VNSIFVAFIVRLNILVLVCVAHIAECLGGVEDVHITGNYPRKVLPHPGLGKFKLQHAPDKPIIAYYGCIGLRGSYNVTSKDDINRLMDKCQKYGINRICASLNGQYTKSSFLSPSRKIPDRAEDLVPYAIEQAHARGIEFYGVVAVFRVSGEGRDRSFLQANPDMLTRDVNDRLDPLMVSPVYPKPRVPKYAHKAFINKYL